MRLLSKLYTFKNLRYVDSFIRAKFFSSISINSRISGFNVEKIERVKDFNMNLIYMYHSDSGARLLHLDRLDPNCAFSVAFPTIPMNDKGTPHILEHMVLCGSKKFPCRDPFFKMITRSVANFMNAMTFPQYTMYIFSTENTKDYMNLMNVYFDAVFNPILNRYDFLQEAWRLIKTDDSSAYIQGVVYNEMKGVLSDSLQDFYRQTAKAMFGFGDSGGHPSDIIKLSRIELKKFHSENYNISKARFITYGSLDLVKVLSQINNLIMRIDSNKLISRNEIHKIWPDVKPSSQNIINIECSKNQISYDANRPYTFTRSFNTEKLHDSWNCFLMKILDLLMFDCESSPLYQNLIASEIATSFLSQSGFDTNHFNTGFHIGLQGVTNVDEARAAIDKSLEQIVSQGFIKEDIEAALHKIELSSLHVNGLFGTHISINILGPWLYGVNLADSLCITEQLDKFRDKLKLNSSLLTDKIKESLINNRTMKEIIMSPNEEYTKRTLEKDLERTNRKIIEIGLKELDVMQQDIIKMQEHQRKSEDLSCLPDLQLCDINKEKCSYNWTLSNISSIPMFVFSQQTNNLVYLRHMFSFSVDKEVLPFLPILCSILTRIGTKHLNYWELSRSISSVSSGIDVSPVLNIHPTDLDRFELGIELSSFCTRKNLSNILELWTEILKDFKEMINRETSCARIKVLICDAASHAANEIIQNGHFYASLRAKSKLQNVAGIHESLFGLSQIEHLQNLRDMKDLHCVVDAINIIYQSMINGDNRFAVHSDVEESEFILNQIEKSWISANIMSNKSDKISPFWVDANAFNKDTELLEEYHIKANVNYCSTAFKINSAGVSVLDLACLKVAASLLTTKFLLPQIREKNGAYGASARFSNEGFMCMSSYRDPRKKDTLNDFNNALYTLINDGTINEDDIRNAKLKTIQEIDRPVSPGNTGLELFNRGITHQYKNDYRRAVISLHENQLRECLKRQLCNASYASCIVGSKM